HAAVAKLTTNQPTSAPAAGAGPGALVVPRVSRRFDEDVRASVNQATAGVVAGGEGGGPAPTDGGSGGEGGAGGAGGGGARATSRCVSAAPKGSEPLCTAVPSVNSTRYQVSW